MRMLVMLAMLSIGALARAEERPRLTGREAPRATDLLRAETLAERARERLRIPRTARAVWKHGGTGWGDTEKAHRAKPSPEAGPVTIRIGSGKRARRRVDG